jgi:hypothetical protein
MGHRKGTVVVANYVVSNNIDGDDDVVVVVSSSSSNNNNKRTSRDVNGTEYEISLLLLLCFDGRSSCMAAAGVYSVGVTNNIHLGRPS